MPPPCPECGARYADGDSGHDRFDRPLALEFTDPAHAAAHDRSCPTTRAVAGA